MFESVRVSKRGAPDAVIAGVFKPETGRPKPDPQTRALPAGEAIARACDRPECTGAAGSVTETFEGSTRVLIVGLGARSEFKAGSLRSALAGAGRRLASAKASRAAIELAGPLKRAKIDAHAAGVAAGECFGLLSFDTTAFKGAGTTDRPQRPRLSLRSTDAVFEKGVARGLGLAESANLCRRWASTPPNVATPMWMASEARRIARGVETLSVRVLKGAELSKERLTGIATVGRASVNEPCLIRVAYTPARPARGARPAVIVGKTITYDTGGLSLKPTNSMKGMKEDKDGGCAALAAMHAIATVVRPRRPVVCLLAAAENCVSDNAYRPDDVLTFRNGVTVEVTNTDAEGRLVLADALCWACDREKPAFIVDLATLTGGVITALGSTFAGLWCEDDALRARVESAAEASGERVWRLPMHDEYREMMKSPIADLVNSNPNRKAHPIQGAAFLDAFVDRGTPWCHLDIAGVHGVDSDTGPYAANTPTGWGVRLLASLMDQE
ncbi:MAG: leucyl aminopeptidase family protein [Planctomycetota bacterium]|nr:MAG: leucyl aminopeptidase family protein [Planctomycetota bacterium]